MHTISYFLGKKILKYRVQVATGLAISLVLLGIILVVYTKIVTEMAISGSKDWEIKLKSSQLTWRELELKALSENEQEARAALRIIRDEYISAQDEISQLNYKLGEREIPVVARRINLEQGVALAPTALVRKPSLPGGVTSWTFETQGHRGPVTRLFYSSDGKQLMSAGKDGIVRTWDAESGQLKEILVDPNGSIDLPLFENGRDAARFSWSADKPAPALDETIMLWEADLPEVWQPLLRTAAAAALSPDRAMMAFGDRDGTIRVLDIKSGQLRYTNVPAWCGPVHSVCFSSDGKVLATCAGTGSICLWDAYRWQPLRKFEAYGITNSFLSGVSTIAWGSGDTLIARPNNRQDAVEILDSQSGQLLRVLPCNSQTITAISWSPDSRLLAVGTTDGTVYLWDTASDSNATPVTLPAHIGRVNALVWTPQKQSLITAGQDGKIEIWEPRSSVRTKSLRGYPAPITCLALSPEGDVLAAGSDNGIIHLWNVGDSWTSTLLRSEPNDVEARESKFTAVAWSPDGSLLASGDSEGKIKIWDPKSRRTLHSLASNCRSINSLVWSTDGRLLICGGADGTARALDVENDFQEHVVLLPLWGSAGPGIAINREGDYRGPPGIAERLFYIVATKRGRETLTPADFKSRFGWVNEPWQVGLYAPGVEEVQRIYVKADAQPPYNGYSWNTAFNDLQSALKLAQPNTEIWVAAGTYRPDRGTGARETSFRLKNGVRLLGGFAGIETDIDLRDPNRNKTVLSGDLKRDDKPNFTNYDDNSYHVVVANNTDSSTVLEGFVIRGGNANGPDPKRADNTNLYGGGFLGEYCSPTLINCTFRYNSAIQDGGGVFIYVGRPILQNCTFTTNRALCHGGGINNIDADTVITNCTFRGNTSVVYGGAINSDRGEPVLRDCIFISNSAEIGGGICTWADQEGGVTSLTNCRFVGNSAKGEGGAIYCRAEQTKLMKLRLTNCTFSGNLAMNRGGGISNQYYYEPILINCTFTKNESSRCGGICNGEKSKVTLTNCVLWANSDSGGMDESAQIEGGTIVVKNSCIKGWSGKLGGTGNFGLDPLFVDPNGPDGKIGTLDDNLRLAPVSPCRNAGDNSALGIDMADLDKDNDVNEPIPFDIDGKPRIHDGVVDIGAYESD